jgi:HPt (histidine-containing phosphotransfer) domain-containing protein
LDHSLQAGDIAKFTRAAHSIKGSSSNLGAMLLRGAAEKLEHTARLQGLRDVAALLTEVKNEFTRAQAALTALITK